MITLKSPVAVLAIAVMASLVAPNARAQWSSDSMTNLTLVDAANDQVQPKIRNCSNGDSYVSWFDQRIGGFDVYLQRLDKDGVAQWVDDGILIADRAVSSTEDYGLAVDANDNAFLGYGLVNFSSMAAQLVNPTGAMQWLPNGVVFSTPGGSHGPRTAATTDGNYVMAWSEGGPTGIVLHKLDSNGTLQWGPGGVTYIDPPNPTSRPLLLCDLQPGDNGSVIALWFRCVGSNCATSAHHLYTQKYDANGAAVWNGGAPVVLFDGSSTANGYFPTCLPDGSGGAVYGWYETGGSQLCYVQRINSAGVEQYAHNGVACTVATPGRMRISAAHGFSAASGEMFISWSEVTLPTQNMWGVRAQKVSAGGIRQWGDQGIVVQALSGSQTSFNRLEVVEDGCVASWIDGAATIKATRLDGTGADVWKGSPRTVSDHPGGKSRMDMAVDGCGMNKLVWSDGPGGTQELLAQNIRKDGTLGPLVPGPLGDMNCDGLVDLNDINPFVIALLEPAAYALAQPCCLLANGDMNADSVVNGGDCNGFTDAIVP